MLLQSALQQDGGAGGSSSRRYTRLLIYDISGMTPEYTAEYVVPLPTFQGTDDGEQIQLVAAQSELQYVTDTQFLILSRDGGRGRGQDETESLYRQVDVFDISAATNVKGADADSTGGSIASEEGVLKAGIVPATYCSFLNINDNKQLGRFGLRNGGPDDPALLNEKWEGLAIVPVEPEDEDGDEYFLFVLSDNDFITQNGELPLFSYNCYYCLYSHSVSLGFMRGGTLPYADSSGANLNNQALVFKVKLPAKGLGAEDD